MNEIFPRKKPFEQQCVLLHVFLNQGEISSHYSFIGLNDVYFNSQCLPKSKCLFFETLSPNNHSQVSLDNKGYQYEVLVSFTATLPTITTVTHRGKISSLLSSMRKGSDTKLRSSFGVTYRKIRDVGMKGRALKAKHNF